MRLNEVTYSDAKPIEGYGPGFFRIGGAVIEGATLVTPNGASAWAGWGDLDTILGLQDQIDVLFVGVGAEIAHIPADFRNAVEAAGIGVEAMATPPACRTYNVLLGEGRRIAAALLPV